MSLQSVGSFTTGITANLLAQATGTAIKAGSLFNQIGTCTSTNNAVLLPTSPYLGQYYKFRNDGAAYCQIFPPVGGTINSLAANAAFLLAGKGGEVDIIA